IGSLRTPGFAPPGGVDDRATGGRTKAVASARQSRGGGPGEVEGRLDPLLVAAAVPEDVQHPHPRQVVELRLRVHVRAERVGPLVCVAPSPPPPAPRERPPPPPAASRRVRRTAPKAPAAPSRPSGTRLRLPRRSCPPAWPAAPRGCAAGSGAGAAGCTAGRRAG